MRMWTCRIEINVDDAIVDVEGMDEDEAIDNAEENVERDIDRYVDPADVHTQTIWCSERGE